MKQKKIPLRKCVATNTQYPKSEMFRIVRTTENDVVVDLTGKLKGRGAYLSKSIDAIKQSEKKRILDRHLEVTVPEKVYQELYRILGDVIE
jgi:predicted RNA-binding protein YlxR (DUF448 family)